MNKIHHKFLTLCFILLVVAGLYSYFSPGGSLHAADATAGTSPKSSSGFGMKDQISLDTAFLSSLVSLNKIKIDNSLFSNQAFKSLHDNTVVLEEVGAGRTDPFSPIDQATNDPTTAPTIVVSTNEPTQITNKTAVLAGGITTVEKVTASYFEYGPTPALGQVTPLAPLSLVGTFVSKVGGLSSQVVYFYRAAVKVNGAIIYGDIISFNTK
jgi:hypothetical protein